MDIGKIKKFIKKRKFVFVGSVDENGIPNVKVMLFPRKNEDCKVFYLSTNTSSVRVKHFKENPNACLYFCNLISFKGVMITGQMEVLHDQRIKQELWRKGDTQYYPKGVSDPDYCVLKFTCDLSTIRTYRI